MMGVRAVIIDLRTGLQFDVTDEVEDTLGIDAIDIDSAEAVEIAYTIASARFGHDDVNAGLEPK